MYETMEVTARMMNSIMVKMNMERRIHDHHDDSPQTEKERRRRCVSAESIYYNIILLLLAVVDMIHDRSPRRKAATQHRKRT